VTDSGGVIYEYPAPESYAWLDESYGMNGPTTADWTDTTFEDYNAAADVAIDAAVPTGNGWELLDRGDPREARRVFTHAVNAHPADALPKIGYALSTALLDRDQEAADVMRQAMRLDPESILDVPQTPAILEQAQSLIDRYRTVGYSAMGERDVHFMMAVMLTLKGELAMAYYTIDTAAERGDVDASAANLKGVLRATINGSSVVPAPQSQPAETEKSPEILF
jgi:hypothetical protein